MNRSIALVAVAVALVGVAGIAAAGPVGTAVAQDGPDAANESDGTANGSDISPGERLSGVIGVQRAEITGEVDSRAFEVGLNRTETPDERADLVSERLNRTEERLAEIERRQRELRERREAGELTPGEFAARMAETGARAETVRREANRSAEVARELPDSIRADRGLDDERLDGLRERASEASGPEVAAVARGIGGDRAGGPLADDRRGPPGNASPGGGPGVGGGPGAGNGPDTGADSGTEGEPGVDDRPGADTGPAGGGHADGAGEADADGDATDAVRGPTDDRGNAENASDGADGGNATPPRDDPSPPAGDDDRGGGNAPGAVSPVVDATERFTGSLLDGADLLRRAVDGVRG